MPHSSPSIGAIAAALAKAQSELVNPEKSLVAILRVPNEPERPFRYAPLSSGLEIIRRSLGRHEIATVQTTSIDAEAGLIRLTTTLFHASGEWVSSDWPVCPVGEVGTPQRMGAALTYARRYALFTLVGIAGEDDLDATGLPVRSVDPKAPSVGNGAAPPEPQTNSSATSSGPSSNRKALPRLPKPVLSAEQSAPLRDRLVSEVGNLTSPDDLAHWAHRVLPQKNTLTREDARLVEEAFQARMTAVPTESSEEPSGRSAAEAESTPDGSNDSSVPHASEAPPGLEEADMGMAFPKTRRKRDKHHLAFVSTQPCLICGRSPCDAHHLRFAQPRALGRKPSDEFTVPLCRAHHRELHSVGNELVWWEKVKIDPRPIAQRLWSQSR